jgi:uncharacterized protein YlaN (UPF0358 family)
VNNQTTMELLTEYAEKAIAASMAQVAGSVSPSIDRIAGEIDLACKLELIDKARRETLLCQLRVVVNTRRQQLREQQHSNLLRASA